MFDDHIRCHVAQSSYGLSTAVFLVNDLDKTYAVQGERGLEWLPQGPEMDHDSVKPLLVMHHRMADIVFRSLVEQLDKRGIKPSDAGETAGKLEAQSEHLQDLRRLIGLEGRWTQPAWSSVGTAPSS